jgi:hypothetical protein
MGQLRRAGEPVGEVDSMRDYEKRINVYHAGLSDIAMLNAIQATRDPSRGVHIQREGRDAFGNHRVRILAPTHGEFNKAYLALEKLATANEAAAAGIKRVKLKDVKRGEFVRRKPDALTTYTRGEYDRSSKTYSLEDWDDINREVFLKGTTLVYIGFEF